MSLSRRCTIPGRSASPHPSSGKRGELGIERQKAGNERARTMGAVGMDDETGRLVDHDDGFVVVDDAKPDLTRRSGDRHRLPALEARPEICLEKVTNLNPAAACDDGHAAESHATRSDQVRDLCSCPP